MTVIKETCLFKTSKHRVGKQDYVFALLASIICACGFALNSETVIIGSMLISPLLKPIINLAISIAKWKPRVIGISLVHSIAMLIGTTLVGAGIGYIFYKVYPKLRKSFAEALDNENENKNIQDTTTILGRVSQIVAWPPSKELAYVSIIAIAGGILLARTNCTDYSDLTTAVIGTGISTSILPPLIAGAMMLTVRSEHSFKKFGNGIILSLINLFLIFASYILTLNFTF